MSDLEAARKSGNDYDEKAYERLDRLRERYDDAHAAFGKSRSDKDKTAYQKAKAAYVEARVAVRQREEADGAHPRGQAVATVKKG